MLKFLAVSAALVATAAYAQAPATPVDGAGDPNNDPDQVVCIVEAETGTRLSKRRVCRTRAQWTEHRQQSRQVIEKVQNYRPSESN